MMRQVALNLFITAAAIATASLHAAIPASQRAALLDMYNGMGGPGWPNQSGWTGPAGTECSWFRVYCDPAQTTVVEISMDNNLMNGALPPSISSLTGLQVLDLNSNNIGGTIPASVSGMVSLKILRLYDNVIGGSLPDVNLLVNLETLDLRYNHFTGSVPPLTGLTTLRALQLSNFGLTGSFPSLGGLSNLEVVEINNSQISGSIPSLAGLANLELFFAQGDQLTGSVPSLAGLTSLRRFDVDRNQLTGGFPDLTGLTSLDELDLTRNRLTGPLPPFPAVPLKNMYLDGNAFVGAVPASITSLPLVSQGMDLRWNGLYSSDATVIAYLNARQVGGDWQGTQTVPPANVLASAPTPTSVTLQWTPIPYTADGGNYKALVATSPGGPYVAFPTTTPDKSSSTLTVTGLATTTPYYFVVTTTTSPHPNNPGPVTSGWSAEVTASTTPVELQTFRIE